MSDISYELGADMALVLKVGTADQAVVKGLNSMGLPGLERSVIEVEEFRNDFARQFAGGGKFGTLTFGGNLVLGDTKGQDQLKSYLNLKTKFVDGRAYLNLNDFMAPDIANDSISAWQVSKYSPGSADKNGVIPLDGEILMNGMVAIFTAHMTATTIAFVDSNPDTLTDTANGFLTAGFEAGQTLIVEDDGTNEGQYLIDTVDAGTITLRATDSLTAVVAGSNVTLHGGKL